MHRFLIDEININGKKYIMYLIIVLVGVFLGTFYFSRGLKDENCYGAIESTINYIKSEKINYKQLLGMYLKRDLFDLLMISFISVSLLYKYGSYLFLGYKGFVFGFLISLLVSVLPGIKGIIISIRNNNFSKYNKNTSSFVLSFSFRCNI